MRHQRRIRSVAVYYVVDWLDWYFGGGVRFGHYWTVVLDIGPFSVGIEWWGKR